MMSGGMVRLGYVQVLAAAAFALSSALPVAAVAENVTTAGAVEGFVRPAYAALHERAKAVVGDMDALCGGQASETLAVAQRDFVALVAAWSEIEIVRFGPITEQNRLERILFWPDRKSIGLKQVQAALADKDATATDPATLKDKSVAMQGLGALEFVLFGTGYEELRAPGDGYRCAYGRAIAENVEAIAGEVDREWRDPAGIAGQWANPEAGNPLYRNDTEAVTELFDVIVHGLELTRDVRLNGFLGEAASDDKPKQAVFWRSAATIVSLRANLQGQRKLFEASGLGALLPAGSAWIAESIDFEFGTADTILGRVDGPVPEVLADAERRGGLAAVRLITSHLSELFGTGLAGELGLTAGFSSLDGD